MQDDAKSRSELLAENREIVEALIADGGGRILEELRK